MAVRGKNAHWHLNKILRRHWQDVGTRYGIASPSGLTVDALIAKVVQHTPTAVHSVRQSCRKASRSRWRSPYSMASSRPLSAWGGCMGDESGSQRACLATGACANLAITLISHGMPGLMEQDASVLVMLLNY